MFSAILFTKAIRLPAWEPSASSILLHSGQVQGLYQSFCDTEIMVASGCSSIHWRTFLVAISTTSGLVRHNWVLSRTRLPSTMEKYSGCSSKYSSGLSSALNVCTNGKYFIWPP